MEYGSSAGKGKNNADWRKMYFLLARGISRALAELPYKAETEQSVCILREALKSPEEAYAGTAFDTGGEVW